MVQALGVQVPAADAERVRKRLLQEGLLRRDLQVLRSPDGICFPVNAAPDGLATASHEFEGRPEPAGSYADLLDWPKDLKALAPRAFDQLGDMVLLKVPEALWGRRHEIGEALLSFLPNLRVVWHDRGVTGRYRTRDLERIAGDGDSLTEVREHGVRLRIDPVQAYYSPRLADERARVATMLQAGEVVLDLFAGVAPFVVQAAKRGAKATGIDINPHAVRLAQRNIELNRVDAIMLEGDCRDVAANLPPADRIIMNLPHGAHAFLDVACHALGPVGMVHYHEILEDADLSARRGALTEELADLGRTATVRQVRHVRNYSATSSHYAFDLEVTG